MRKFISILVVALILANISIIPIYASYTLTNDAYTVVNYAKTAVGTHEMSRKGLCQTFAWECLYNTLRVSNKAGCGCCATKAWQSYGVSSSRDDIPLGAMVYFGGSSTIDSVCGQEAGHVGVYIGNNEIAHAWSSTIICKTTIDYVINCGYYYRGWGWQGGYALATATPAAPTITSVSTVSTSSLKVKWNAVSGATAYRINRRRSGDEEYSTIVSSTTSTSYTDTGLLAGEKYYYRVYALNGSVTSDRSESVGAYTQCKIPEITSAVGDSTSSITIKWNYVNGASYYRIDRRKQTEDAYSTIVANHTGSRTYTDTGLVAGAKYYYRVYAVNDSSTSAKPDGYGGYTQCEIPTITSFVANSPSSITIKWNGVSGAASYRIDRRKQADDAYTTIVTGYTSKSYTDTGLEAGTKYYYRIYAVTEGSVSAKPDGEGTFTKYIYTVNYNANGGSGAPDSQSKIQDTSLTLSSTKPTRTGYTFVNWNTKADGSGTAYSSRASYTANGNVTLYAQWKINSYYFDLNMVLEDTSGNKVNFGLATADVYINGTLVADDVTDYYTMHPYGTTYEIKDIKTATGYSYLGISEGNISGKIGIATTVVGIYFKPNKYIIKYNGNGADSGNMNPSEHTYDTTSNLSVNKFERKGYKFKGWSVDTLSNAVYADEQKITNLTSQDNEIINLYAQWEKVAPYTESVVNKKGYAYYVNVVPINVDDSCEIILAGYKGNKFVTLAIIPYESKVINTTLSDDIDEIKVFVWNSLPKMMPLCEAEVIPSSEFIVE